MEVANYIMIYHLRQNHMNFNSLILKYFIRIIYIIMKLKSILYKKEQDEILDKLINILKLGDNNSKIL